MMSAQASQVRVRFAPSPTGHLHIGGLRTALFNWLFARHHNGIFLLRFEDTDSERSKPEFMHSQLNSLRWCGIESDEPIVIQSQRIHEHHRLIDQLIDEGKAYRCFCTQEEIRQRNATHQHQEVDYSKYDRFCRDKPKNPQDHNSPHVVRFKVPLEGSIQFDDVIRDTITIDMDQLDDFIIMRSDGLPMYNVVVVIDDAYMRISHVIRGEEHISNTPKQILLYQAFGYSLPHFAHLPMILAPSGAKLSKREGATDVLEYKKEGILPDALCNYLVRLGWAHGDQELFSRDEMIRFFSLEQVSKKGAIFDREKLLWISTVYLRQASDEKLLDCITNQLQINLSELTSNWDDLQRLQAIGLYKMRASILKELIDEIKHVHKMPLAYNPADIATWITPQSLSILTDILTLIKTDHDWSLPILSALIKEYAAQKNIKMVAITQPLRLALLGKSAGPGVLELMVLLGKSECVIRLERLITYLKMGS